MFFFHIPAIFAVILFFLYPISTVFALELSIDEQAYLRSKGSIVFVSQTRYPPFEFVDKNNDRNGMCIELARWIATEFGFTAKFTDTHFKQAQQDILSGKADVLTSFFYSKKRDEAFGFTQLMFEVPASIFVVAERTDIKDIQDLNGKRIAMQTGDYAKEFLESKNIEFDVVYTKNFAEATDLVIAGKADAIIGDEQIVLYHIFKDNLTDKIKKIGDPLYIGQNCMATKEGNRVLISIIDKGIKLAQKSGVLEKINRKWIGTHYTLRESMLFKYLPYLYVAVGAMLALSLLIWFWNVQLRQSVKERTEKLRESEERFKDLTNLLPQPVWETDLEGNFTYANRAGYESLGYTPKDLEEGVSVADVIAPEARERVVANFDKTLRGIEFENHECTCLTKDGRKFPALIYSSLIIKDGEPSGVRGVTLDITERKRAEKALIESRETYRNIFENSVVGFFQSTPEGRFITVNPAFAKILGYSSPEEIVSSISDIAKQYYLVPEDRRQYQQVLQESGQVENYEFRARRKDGSQVWVSNSTRAYFDPDGKVIHYEGIVIDITKRKNLENQLQQVQKMEAIGTLAGGIAHDFNNVLYSIIGYTELTMDDVPEGSLAQNNLKEVLKGAMRAKDMVQQILAFSRKADTEKKPIKIQSVVNEALKLLRTSIPSTIELRQNIDADCGPVLADSTQIHQVVMNLATNAYQAMREKGGVLELTLMEERISSDDSEFYLDLHSGIYLKLTVSDTGHGMDNAVMEKIFDPYFTTRGPGEGTGMGLAMVHGIVKDHGGNIKVYSELGEGTVFHIYLPSIKTRPLEPKTITTEPALNGKEHILFVDDEKPIVLMTQQMLERLGYQVTTRTSSVEALEAFKAKPNEYDLVITDMTMPNMTGVELASRLKEVRSDIPIIICTGFSEMIDEDKAKNMGILGYVMKPILKDKIAGTIRKVLDEGQEKKSAARILIIDDDAQLLAMLRQTLELEGYEVVKASDGKEGLRRYRENPTDLIITDLIMPEKEGIETIMELRRNYPDVKIIAISGGGRLDPGQYLSMAKSFGAQHTFAKPVEREELLNAVRELLN